MLGKREMPEDVYGIVPQYLSDKVKAGLLEPESPVVECTLVGTTSGRRRRQEPRNHVSFAGHPAGRTMGSEPI